ncbi:chemotaxis-specific protein-glutamate methyltransferase CheB [Sphingomonas sp. BIUV-7]|uniref:Protein-glutamate methylesterase/protein-glutamine glutaminase n=1 Tax=Sphingomonas natans TaxID=3063330 RepID=A0ABT8YEB7_9SPHN|nr:chemotaxis-specific protein-glutamate methyltransferase CheB [Sphingomonas sp. BIUV-7]MDO6416716.1 chemotaxis-specific protein-glutamate methyltransferase CheB [Sphingomonas sp. BIUV-7]
MTRLLIVDDSPLMRRLLSEIFAAEADFEVAVARSGAEALAQLATFKPDVITLDIHMPGMDGLACLDRIMVERPCPVVMISSLTAEGADETLEAIALGAIDFVAKPRGPVSIEIETIAPALVEKVRAASRARMSRATRLADRVRLRTSAPALGRTRTPASRGAAKPVAAGGSEGLVLVGTSTGGPAALDKLLGQLPADFPWPIVIAQHMPASFTGALARRLDKICALSIVEVARQTPLVAGTAYIGRGDADVLISRRAGALVALAAPSAPELHWHPSVDRLVASAMQYLAPERLIGVLMTGMGADGAQAMAKLAEKGGQTIAEAEESAIVWGMPGALVALGGADHVVPLDAIAARLTGLIGR